MMCLIKICITSKLLFFFQCKCCIIRPFSPQISYGATSDKFSDSLVYPSFFRTVPSDKWQVDAIARLMNEFKWNWVAVVGSEEEYGQQGVQQFSKIAENMSICVAYQGLIPVYTDSAPAIRTIIENIQSTQVKVVVVISLPELTELFFKEVRKTKSQSTSYIGISWVTGDGHLIHSIPGHQAQIKWCVDRQLQLGYQ